MRAMIYNGHNMMLVATWMTIKMASKVTRIAVDDESDTLEY